MNTLPLDLYKVIAYGLGNDTWQQFVDRYNEKYNTAQVDGFEFAPLQLSYTFQQLVAETGAHTLPAYVDPESPGYEAALREVQGKTGNIPTMKKFYRLNRVIVSERLRLLQQVGSAGLTPEMQNVFMGLIDEGTDGLIGSFMNALTHQRMQIVSTGKFTIDDKNNPRGLQGITINFLDQDHYDTLTTTARWWTNATHTSEGSAADPIQYIKDRVKYIRRTKHYLGGLHVEISQDLYDDLLTHTAVLKRIGHAMFPTSADDTAAIANAKNLAENTIGEWLNRLCGIDIVPKDSVSYVDTPDATNHDIVTSEIESFDSKNIAFVPDGKLGDIMGVAPITLGYDADKVALYDGGRLVLTQRAIPETHSIYIESEAAQLCVPSAVRGMFVSTVTA